MSVAEIYPAVIGRSYKTGVWGSKMTYSNNRIRNKLKLNPACEAQQGSL